MFHARHGPRPRCAGWLCPTARTPRKESPMRSLRLLRSRSAHQPSRPYRYVVPLLAALALLVVPAGASAANGFTEEIASARWLIPFQCPDGSTANGRLIVETDNFIEAGTTPDPNPPLRVGFVVVRSEERRVGKECRGR